MRFIIKIFGSKQKLKDYQQKFKAVSELRWLSGFLMLTQIHWYIVNLQMKNNVKSMQLKKWYDLTFTIVQIFSFVHNIHYAVKYLVINLPLGKFHELVTARQIGIVEDVVWCDEQGNGVASISCVEEQFSVDQYEKLGSRHKWISCNRQKQKLLVFQNFNS